MLDVHKSVCTNSSYFSSNLKLECVLNCMYVCTQSRDVIKYYLNYFTCSFHVGFALNGAQYLQFVLAPVLPVPARGVHVVGATVIKSIMKCISVFALTSI